MFKSKFKKFVNWLGFDIQRFKAPVAASKGRTGSHIQDWKNDPRFQDLWLKAKPFTLLPELDAYLLYQLAVYSIHLSGDLAEIGVYRGGTASLLAQFAERAQKQLHLFDTFAGMPSTNPEKDWHIAGDFNDTSLEEVKLRLGATNWVRFYPGLFPATTEPVRDSTFCLVHIDVDIYQSVKDCCEFFYPRLHAGGVMLFDDYGKWTCPGAKLAVDEFFATKPEKRFYFPSGQCFVIKQP